MAIEFFGMKALTDKELHALYGAVLLHLSNCKCSLCDWTDDNCTICPIEKVLSEPMEIGYGTVGNVCEEFTPFDYGALHTSPEMYLDDLADAIEKEVGKRAVKVAIKALGKKFKK